MLRWTAAVALVCVSLVRADDPVVMNVWPAAAPGETGKIGDEGLEPPNAKSPAQRVNNVTKPTLAIYKPKEKANGTAVVICPGGGYNILAYDKEGTEVAEWLNTLGVTGIVLKYRVPRREGLPKHQAPLQDAQRAMSIVRQHASEWEIDPDRIGILGFSAGGHLSATASTNFDKRAYDTIDETDKVSCRPDFTILIYPAYVLEKGQMAPELTVTEKTPQMFFAHAYNDSHGPENSIALFNALQKVKVPAELHVYATGGHGFGLRPSQHPVSTWPARCGDWMKSQGLLAPKQK